MRDKRACLPPLPRTATIIGNQDRGHWFRLAEEPEDVEREGYGFQEESYQDNLKPLTVRLTGGPPHHPRAIPGRGICSGRKPPYFGRRDWRHYRSYFAV